MRRLALIVLAVGVLPGAAAAQTYGQPWSGPAPTSFGQPYGGPVGYGQSHGYGAGDGDPRAWRPPARYGYVHDRGGRYGYSAHAAGQWSRGGSPPGRGDHDVHGYNDDRPPRGADHGRYRDGGCGCGAGAWLHDR